MKTTGRKFRCIGLEEPNSSTWKQSFTIGNTYDEVEYLSNNESTLCLIGNMGLSYFVDASQFELVQDEN